MNVKQCEQVTTIERTEAPPRMRHIIVPPELRVALCGFRLPVGVFDPAATSLNDCVVCGELLGALSRADGVR